MSQLRSFEHSLSALTEIFAFVEEAFAVERVDDGLRHGVDFVIEELFTNIVKYGHGRSPVRIEIGAVDRGVEVTVTEFDADRFDVTRPSAVDVTLPAASRRPGGLGLHLVGHLVESIDYSYAADERRGRIRFRIAPADAMPPDPAAGSRPC